jgi:hypothetical protein
MRGRHFAFIGLFFAAWVSARVGFLRLMSPDSAATKLASTPRAEAAAPLNKRLITILSVGTRPRAGTQIPNTSARMTRRLDAQPLASAPVFSAAPSTNAIIEAPAPQPLAFATQSTAEAPAKRRLEIYAYSFVRRGSQTIAPLGSGQYGGSQSAIIAAYPLLHFKADAAVPRLSLVGRVAAAHDDRADRELAAGLRWQPARQIPVHFTAERRFRQGRADAFALYAAGGKSGIALPFDFRLDGYAQAGFVSGKQGGAFADFSTRTDRQIAKSDAATLAGGVGVWGGGQRGIRRVDIGPSLRADVVAGGAQFRLVADWRFRVAGSARPGNGPALTLSTSF